MWYNTGMNMKTILVIAMLLVGSAHAGLAASRPNVLFILTDDLGYGDLGATWQNARAEGLPRIKTPNIDRLAARGVTLSNHYCAAPVCAPSRASILTGRVQGECSLRDNCFDQPFAERETIGSVMHDAGYATWAVGKWGIAGGGESGKPVTSHPLDRGFDYFYGFLDHMAGHTYYHYEGNVRGAFMGITENRTNATDSAKGIYSTDLFAAKTKQLISDHMARSPEKPFFLYLAMNTIHGSGFCGDDLKCKTPLHVPGIRLPATSPVHSYAAWRWQWCGRCSSTTPCPLREARRHLSSSNRTRLCSTTILRRKLQNGWTRTGSPPPNSSTPARCIRRSGGPRCKANARPQR